ncbi:hypothetical protein X742_33150 [Mesorhizobium sp. LNHC232B00]|nr:hypothetical protein X742_33150 [Mesorhizobium sp. LNHC232B00]
MRYLLAIAATLLAMPAQADIRTFMDNWVRLERLEIRQGNNSDCGANDLKHDTAVDKGWTMTWPGTGTTGDSICYRRGREPDNPTSPWGAWVVCTVDGDCEIE